jgi:antitoxin MazE
MKTRIVKIGNSRGVRIPKPLLQQANLDGDVELEAQDGRIVIRSIRNPRQGWDEAFRQMADLGDDVLLDDEIAVQTSWDEDEWEW